MKLWHSREQAREIFFGLVDDNYKWVPAIKVELIIKNLGSHVTYRYNCDDH